MLRSMQLKMGELSELNRKLATGRRIHRFSDDVEDAGMLLRLKRKKGALSTYEKNLQRVKSSIATASGRLQNTTEVLSQARELTTQAASETFTDANLKSMAHEIDGILDQVLSNANVTKDGKHIFAGRGGEEPAYSVTRNAEGQITSVEYEGANRADGVPVAPGRRQRKNLVGPDFFQRTGNVFDTLIKIRDEMQNGSREKLRGLIDDLKHAQQGVNSAQAELGTELNGVKMIKKSLESLSMENKKNIADIEDTDMARVSTEYQRQMTALQAVIKLASKVRPTSLAKMM